MDISPGEFIGEYLIELLKGLWFLVVDPRARRESGMDKVLHFGISFFLALGIAVPIINRWKLGQTWILIALVPGIAKEVWDFFFKIVIQGRSWLRPIFIDSFWDLVADSAGIFFAWIVWRLYTKRD